MNETLAETGVSKERESGYHFPVFQAEVVSPRFGEAIRLAFRYGATLQLHDLTPRQARGVQRGLRRQLGLRWWQR